MGQAQGQDYQEYATAQLRRTKDVVELLRKPFDEVFAAPMPMQLDIMQTIPGDPPPDDPVQLERLTKQWQRDNERVFARPRSVFFLTVNDRFKPIESPAALRAKVTEFLEPEGLDHEYIKQTTELVLGQVNATAVMDHVARMVPVGFHDPKYIVVLYEVQGRRCIRVLTFGFVGLPAINIGDDKKRTPFVARVCTDEIVGQVCRHGLTLATHCVVQRTSECSIEACFNNQFFNLMIAMSTNSWKVFACDEGEDVEKMHKDALNVLIYSDIPNIWVYDMQLIDEVHKQKLSDMLSGIIARLRLKYRQSMLTCGIAMSLVGMQDEALLQFLCRAISNASMEESLDRIMSCFAEHLVGEVLMDTLRNINETVQLFKPAVQSLVTRMFVNSKPVEDVVRIVHKIAQAPDQSLVEEVLAEEAASHVLQAGLFAPNGSMMLMKLSMFRPWQCQEVNHEYLLQEVHDLGEWLKQVKADPDRLMKTYAPSLASTDYMTDAISTFDTSDDMDVCVMYSTGLGADNMILDDPAVRAGAWCNCGSMFMKMNSSRQHGKTIVAMLAPVAPDATLLSQRSAQILTTELCRMIESEWQGFDGCGHDKKVEFDKMQRVFITCRGDLPAFKNALADDKSLSENPLLAETIINYRTTFRMRVSMLDGTRPLKVLTLCEKQQLQVLSISSRAVSNQNRLLDECQGNIPTVWSIEELLARSTPEGCVTSLRALQKMLQFNNLKLKIDLALNREDRCAILRALSHNGRYCVFAHISKLTISDENFARSLASTFITKDKGLRKRRKVDEQFGTKRSISKASIASLQSTLEKVIECKGVDVVIPALERATVVDIVDKAAGLHLAGTDVPLVSEALRGRSFDQEAASSDMHPTPDFVVIDGPDPSTFAHEHSQRYMSQQIAERLGCPEVELTKDGERPGAFSGLSCGLFLNGYTGALDRFQQLQETCIGDALLKMVVTGAFGEALIECGVFDRVAVSPCPFSARFEAILDEHEDEPNLAKHGRKLKHAATQVQEAHSLASRILVDRTNLKNSLHTLVEIQAERQELVEQTATLLRAKYSDSFGVRLEAATVETEETTPKRRRLQLQDTNKEFKPLDELRESLPEDHDHHGASSEAK